MTSRGGYCDPNGDASYTDGDWVRGYNEYYAACRTAPPPPPPPPTCRCANGTDYWGRAIDPSTTYCGFRVCGRDNQNYECRSTGWAAIGGSPCATLPPTCRCTNGTDYWGVAVDPNQTFCGFRVCGRDDQYYECRSTGWAAIGGSPCHTGGGLDCYGIGINANGPLGAPTPAELDQLGTRWVRTLVRDGKWNVVTNLANKINRSIHGSLRPQILVVFNQESFASECGPAGTAPPGTCTWNGYFQAYSREAERFLTTQGAAISAFEIWNEPDLSGLSYDRMAFLVIEASPRLRALTTKPILLSAPAGPNWQSYLQSLLNLLGGTARYDGLSFHPYGTSIPGVDYVYAGRPTLEASILNAYNAQPNPKKPIWVTEFGVPLSEISLPVPAPPAANRNEIQALYLSRAYSLFASLGPNVVAHGFWFAWSDNVHSLGGAPSAFGLVDANLRRRPSWEAFRRCAKLGACPATTAGLLPPTAPVATRCPCAFYDASIDNYCFYPPIGREAICPSLSTTLCPNIATAPNFTTGATSYRNACWTNCTSDDCGVQP